MSAPGFSVSRLVAQSRPGQYVCRTCRDHFLQTGVTTQKRFAPRHIFSPDRATTRTRQDPSQFSVTSGVSTSSNFVQQRQFRSRPAGKALERPSDSSAEAALSEAAEEYKPAETWDGLERVGYDGDWRNVPAESSDTFTGWLPSNTQSVKTRESTISCLHQAIVECLVCDEAGLDISSAAGAGLTDAHRDAFTSAEIVVSESGRPVEIRFASEEQRREVVEMLAVGADYASSNQEQEIIQEAGGIPEDIIIDPVVPNVDDASMAIPSSQNKALNYQIQNQSFLGIRLDPQSPVTFTILKRFSQLSGNRIPDPVINTLLTSHEPLSYLIEQFYSTVVRPKSKKVADILLNMPELSSQSNLMVFPRRETPVDKHKEVGRWKVIEKELRERGLPVLGKLKA